ncbi:hypothetical protein [Dyella flagellata]|uniref:hypothetical protein n=1 Tax=Dyella flagellata TaxID=1867833 RepID=UPI0024E0B0EF|nr:hypothetical protein [Dyella flagellata]
MQHGENDVNSEAEFTDIPQKMSHHDGLSKGRIASRPFMLGPSIRHTADGIRIESAKSKPGRHLKQSRGSGQPLRQ